MVALDELTDEYLRSLDRRSLQALCKEHNIKANLKNAVIIDELMRLKDAAQVAQASTDKDGVETPDNDADASDAETPFSSSPGPIPLTPSAARIAASSSGGGTPAYSAAADDDDEPHVMAFAGSPAGAPTVDGLNDVSLLTHSIGSSPDHAKLGNSATATPSLSLQVQPDALHSMGSPPDVADTDGEAAVSKPSPTTSNVMAELERRVQEAIKAGAYAEPSMPFSCSSTPLTSRTADMSKTALFDSAHKRQFERMQSIATMPAAQRTPRRTPLKGAAGTPSRQAGTPSRLERALLKTPSALTGTVHAISSPAAAAAAAVAPQQQPAPATAGAATPGSRLPRINGTASKPRAVTAAPASRSSSTGGRAAPPEPTAAPAKRFVARPAPSFTKPGAVPVKAAPTNPTTAAAPAPRTTTAAAAPAAVAPRPAPLKAAAKQSAPLAAPAPSRRCSSQPPAEELPPLPAVLASIADENLIDAIPPASKRATSPDAPVVVQMPMDPKPAPRKRIPYDPKASLGQRLPYKPHKGPIRIDAGLSVAEKLRQERAEKARRLQAQARAAAVASARSPAP